MLKKYVGTFAIGAAFAVSCAHAFAQQSHELTLTSASPAGLWSVLAAGVDNALRANHPGSVITNQTSGGGLANVAIVAAGQAELGIGHNVELRAALAGDEPFDSPVENLRAIAVLYDWAPMQMVVTKSFADEYGIESLKDLAEEKPPIRIAVNQRGNMVQEMNKQILAAHGITYQSIQDWGGQIIYATGGDMVNLFNDNRIDMAGNGVFVPDSRFTQVAQHAALTLLPLEPDAIEQVAEATGAEPYVIEAGGYEWLEADVPTVALSAVLFANEGLSEQAAYDLTKALVENIENITEVHQAMSPLNPELLAGFGMMPYHPGAEKYYREAGLME